ncbi:MAG: HupE/UreJ family protein [Caulobacterales bacterium]
MIAGRLLCTLFCLMALLLFAAPVSAHEVRPAYLEVTEHSDKTIDVLFKQPAAATLLVKLEPEISGGLLDTPPSSVEAGTGYQIRRWAGLNGGESGLGGRTLAVHGLERSITDALVVVRYADGHELQELLKPERESLALDARGDGLPVSTYLTFGIEHILTGYDHLLFVLGLVLLVRGIPTLLKTITAFTVAHSITLAATALGAMHVKPAKIEALVALSIVFVAVELANQYRGRSTLTTRWPWLIAFGFGLLHGSAFAGALSEIGLPQNNIPAALFLFNFGVEIGQLLFVAVVLAAIFVLRRLSLPASPILQRAPAYCIGGFAAFWLFDRFHAAVF